MFAYRNYYRFRNVLFNSSQITLNVITHWLESLLCLNQKRSIHLTPAV